MVKKLRSRIVILAAIGTFVLMTFLVGIMNAVNYISVIKEADRILDVVSQPDAPFFDGRKPHKKKEIGKFMPRGMSPEVPYESRFFMARVTKDGNVIDSDISRIVSVDDESAEEYIQAALKSGSDRGFINDFRYSKTDDGKYIRVFFLDCGRKLDAFSSFMWTSIIIGIFGCIIVCLFFVFASKKLVKPIEESNEMQKRFITDAGHEIKTPLTIINANVDLLEDDIGSNDCISDIRQQTKRLANLTNDMIYLSKIQESGIRIKKEVFDISEAVLDTIMPFKALAESGQIKYTADIKPCIMMNGGREAIVNLVSVITDNAIKYASPGGNVDIRLYADKKYVYFTAENSVDFPVSQEMLNRLFERFYRTDNSRNSETGGHGLGLSIAKAVTEAHGGKITAAMNDDGRFSVVVELPL